MTTTGIGRRGFLGAMGIGAAALSLGSGTHVLFGSKARAAPGASTKGRGAKTLVVVFLRGGMDGISAVVPHAERRYYELRPQIAIAQPKRSNGALDLDGRFGLHPALGPLKPFYDQKLLAPIVCLGSPDATRSHFDAQDRMESGVVGRAALGSGWANRSLLAKRGGKPASTFQGVALTSTMPLAMRGRASVLATPKLSEFGLSGPDRISERLQRGFSALYEANGGDPISQSGTEALAAVRKVKELGLAEQPPKNGASYHRPRNGGLIDVARLIHADLGMEIAWVDRGGWDTHANQGSGQSGVLSRSLTQLATDLAAFRQDLGERMKDVVVLVMTEFGRTAAQNGSRGTDHGHGSVGLLLGGPVRGGKVYGRFAGLDEDQLYKGRDLAVTFDYRDLLTEVLDEHLGVRDPQLFPKHRAAAPVGLLA